MDISEYNEIVALMEERSLKGDEREKAGKAVEAAALGIFTPGIQSDAALAMLTESFVAAFVGDES